MLRKNQNIYSTLIARLALTELTALYERSQDYPLLCSAIENEIDQRLATTGQAVYVNAAGRLAADPVLSTTLTATAV